MFDFVLISARCVGVAASGAGRNGARFSRLPARAARSRLAAGQID